MSLIAIKTPDQVSNELDQAAEKSREADSGAMLQSTMSQLAGMVRSDWETAKNFKRPMTQRLNDCLRRRMGEYPPEKLEAIRKTGGSDIFMRITGAKCRAAKAWLADLFSPAGDKPFTMEPTPIPELPPEIMRQMIQEAQAVMQQSGMGMEDIQDVMQKHRDRLMDELLQEAEERADRMSDKIEDVLTEAQWREEFDEFLDDVTTYPFAVLKGLEFRSEKKLQWVEMETGQFVPQMDSVITRRVRRVSPFRFYWSPSARHTLDGHWCIEHCTFTRADLAAMRDAPGYNADQIALALSAYSFGGLKEWMWDDEERQLLTGQTTIYNTETIDAIEWSGSLQGQRLIELGMPADAIDDPYNEYSVSLIVVGDYVIRSLVNPDPAGKQDYFVTSWQNIPGSLAGMALAEDLSDCQDQCNAAARSLINNMGMSSGPQVWVNIDEMADNADIQNMFPWKIWHGSSERQSGQPGITFFQPNSNASELLNIYERFNRYADDITGLPSYAYGSDQGAGAAKTASGLSMLMNAASKTVKSVVRNIDIRVIEPLVEKIYNHLMLFDPDPEIKGDLIPKARGSESLVHKEAQMMRQQELLAITGNPIDLEIIGQEGRLEQLREVFRSGDIPVDRILPDKEELRQRMEAQQQAMMQAQQAQQQGQPPMQGPPSA